MKTLFILILSALNMTNTNFEILLGKNISEASFMGVVENIGDDNIYTISNPHVQFQGKPIDHIGIVTDENKAIKRIIIFFPQPIEASFYKIISDEYVDNYDIMVVDEVLSEESSSTELTDDSFKETLKQRTMSLKKGSIEDSNINNILWNKDNFLIMLYFNYYKNRCSFYKQRIVCFITHLGNSTHPLEYFFKRG
jgi:hypothetical protein